MIDKKNTIKVFYFTLNQESSMEIPLKYYDYKKIKPCDYTIGAEQEAEEFVKNYNRQAFDGGFSITQWDWCFSYVDPKYLDSCRKEAVKSLLMQKFGRYNLKYNTMYNTYLNNEHFYDEIIKKMALQK